MSLKKSIESAQRLQPESIPMVRSKKARNRYVSAPPNNVDGNVHTTTKPTVDDQIVRIHSESDPVKFLMDVLEGKAFQEYVVNPNGTITERHVTPSMQQRIKVAEFLTEKIIPKMTIHKRVIEQPDQPSAPWTKMVTDASNKAG